MLFLGVMHAGREVAEGLDCPKLTSAAADVVTSCRDMLVPLQTFSQGNLQIFLQRFKSQIGAGACHLQLANLQVLQVHFFEDSGVSVNASALRSADLGKRCQRKPGGWCWKA